ncbi:ATPase with role in protein import into the ER [Podila horticola]|nr:ATPase with role in protein import into the ER [Podila horticola]
MTGEENDTVIAIDLGTSYSTVGVCRDDHIEIIPNAQGNRRTPSYVAFTRDGRRLIGQPAKDQLITNPRNTIFNIKRLIGRRFDDETVQDSIAYLPYMIVSRSCGVGIEVQAKGQPKTITPEEISAMILSELKRVAEAHLGRRVTRAIITVPGYFYDAQRQATKDAGTIAGLEVVRLINEPMAAALATGLSEKPLEGIVLVFSFGGGFIDVSVLSITEGVYEVLGTSGVSQDSNRPLIDFILQQYQKLNGVNLSKDPRAIANITLAAEKAKLTLSSEPSVTIEISSIFGSRILSADMTCAQFEELNKHTLDTIIPKLLEQGLISANKTKADVDRVVVVGGSSHIPAVASILESYFGRKKIAHVIIDPEEAAAHGASYESLRVSGVSKTTPDILVIDACSRALSLEGPGSIAVQIIKKDSSVPLKHHHVFTNSEDGQSSISVKLFEGEKKVNDTNNQLATYNLLHIQPLPAGEGSYQISFDVDESGIVHASALNKNSGQAEVLSTVYRTVRLSDQDIKQMKEDLVEW